MALTHSLLLALAGQVAATVVPTVTVTGTAAAPTGFPKYIIDDSGANALLGQTYKTNGYACIRGGMTWVWPQVITSNAVETSTTSSTIRAFYASAMS